MKAEVRMYDQWCPTQQRENYMSLILHFQQRYKKTRHKLEKLNRYRVWLGVATLSDITKVSESRLYLLASRGEQHPHRITIPTWRNQSAMIGKSWRIWNKALRATFTYDGAYLPPLPSETGSEMQYHRKNDPRIVTQTPTPST